MFQVHREFTIERRETASLLKVFRNSPCGRPCRDKNRSLYQELLHLKVPPDVVTKMAFVLVVCGQKQREFEQIKQVKAKTRRLAPAPDPTLYDGNQPDEYPDYVSAHESIKRKEYLETGRVSRTKPTDTALDVAATQLSEDMKCLTGRPGYGPVGQLLYRSGLLPEKSYKKLAQDVRNHRKKSLPWPYWARLWRE